MALTLIATPIGNLQDITLRALNSLKEAELFIGEERKPMFRLIKELGLPTPQNFELLNEHSSPGDISRLAELCSIQKAILVCDCGTPGFSDPGAELVTACRKMKIAVTSNPGPSALTTFISLCGLRLSRFEYYGFLPRESGERLTAFKSLAGRKQPTIVMDTAYRLKKTLQECDQVLGHKQFILGMELTKPNEKVFSGSIQQILKQYDGGKYEFLLMIY